MAISSNLSALNINPLELIAALPGHVYWVNREGVLLGCNEQLAQSLKVKSSNDIVNKHMSEFLPQEEVDAIMKNNLEVINSGKPLFIEESASYRTNDEVYLSYKVPLKNKAGEIVGILGISFDVTQKAR